MMRADRFPFLRQTQENLFFDLPKLRPCPFCGSVDVALEGHKRVNVSCTHCKAEGPVSQTSDDPRRAIFEAVFSWNERMAI
jgi:Restriction alleviation protein Lar